MERFQTLIDQVHADMRSFVSDYADARISDRSTHGMFDMVRGERDYQIKRLSRWFADEVRMLVPPHTSYGMVKSLRLIREIEQQYSAAVAGIEHMFTEWCDHYARLTVDEAWEEAVTETMKGSFPGLNIMTGVPRLTVEEAWDVAMSAYGDRCSSPTPEGGYNLMTEMPTQGQIDTWARHEDSWIVKTAH